MASIEKITRHPYINNIKKINEIIDELNRLLASYEKDVWRLDKNINKIAKNTDLNSLITQGTYTCPDATVAATLGHTPHTSSNFRLVVTENISGYISQIVYVYNDAVYMRGRSGGNNPTWTDWHKNAWTDSDITGNAATATKLKTPVSLQTNLASFSPANFDGSQNVSIGVTGVLPISHGGTGKTNLNDVKVGSASHADEASYATKAGSIEPELIPANVDLNSYTHYGLYYCPKNVDAATIGHCPTDGNAFALVVLLEAGVAQICVQYGTNTHNIYHRNYYNGAWGDWALFITDKNIGIYFDEIEDVIRTVRGDGTDKYPHIDTRIDEGDFLNMAPKIGRYGEDQVQVTSSYNISNIAFAFRRAPVITSDALDREVMYFIGNGGGPDAVNNVALHKAYKAYGSGESIDGTVKPVWNWYNYDVVPQCLADKKNLVIKTIYGCDNTYLIVKVEEGPQNARATKFYRIATNYQFDEAKWVHCQDITAALLPENDRIPGTEQTQRYLLYTKYFPQYHTLAAVWSISLNAKQANWYYITIWDCGKTFDSIPSFVYGTAFTGQGSLYKTAAGYSFDEQSGDKEAVISPANSTRATINIDAAAGEENGACNVLIYEKENTLTIVNYNIRIHIYKKSAAVLSSINNVPIVFKLSDNFFSADKNIARSITTYNEPGDYLVGKDSAYQAAIDELNAVGLASQVNNVSYDSKKKKAYTIGMGTGRSIRIRKFAAADFDTLYSEDKYRGLKAEAFSDTFCCPDASKWGKAFRVGTALWDRFIFGCLNNKGESCLQITEWQKVQDYPDSNLYIEPKPGNPKSVSTQVFRNVLDEDLFKFTGDISPRLLNGELLFNEEKFPWDTYTILPGIVSVKRVDQNNKAEYYKAQYNKETKKIIWCQFKAKQDGNNVELDPIEIQRDIKDPISVTDLKTSLFNTGNADETFIYPGFVAYNPMMKQFYIWGICDGTYTTTGNIKIPHLVSIDATTGKATSLNFQEPDTEEIRISKPNDYNWTGTDSKYPSEITGNTYYTPYMPYGCVIIDKTHMIVFFQCGMPGSSRHIYGLLYTFSEDGKTLSSVTVCSTNQTGIGYLDRGYNSYCGNMPLIYAGPKLGLCGFGETKNGTSYYKDNYKLDIRTQYPIYKPGQNEKLFENTSSYTDKQIIENSTSMFENINNYTMFNQSSGGLTAFIPPLEIFLGGYHSITETGIEVVLQPNKDNFIYLKRVNGDRTADGIVAEVDAESTEPMIPPGTSVFDKICIAKVTTDADKPIATKIYTVNTGDNSWKFQPFNPSVDIYLET